MAIENKSNIVKANYKVLGMTCASCAISLETYLKPVTGIKEVMVNYPNQSLAITYDKNLAPLAAIRKKTQEIGYDLLTGTAKESQHAFNEIEKKRSDQLKTKLILSAIFSLPVFIISMFFMGVLPYENWIMLGLSAPVLFWFGSDFFVVAWKKAVKLSANMDTLVVLSTGIAFLFSVGNTVYPNYLHSKGIMPHVYYESAVIIITLILLGRYLEEKAKSNTSSAIKALMGLKPKDVVAVRNGEEMIIPLDEIVKGELVIVKPGDKIPVDGKVKKGASYIDESMITGEPQAVKKNKGDLVYAGTINQKGSLKILATKIGEDTFLSQIIQLVEQAQASKPAIQKLVDKIAGIFVPIVLLIAIITFVVWYIAGPAPSLTYALLSCITVLIIACPCALGLATPTALMVGIGKGAQQGILVKDAQALETIYKANALVVDKTGTLTEGRPTVTDSKWTESNNLSVIKQVLYSIEAQSEHPIASAITQHLKNEEVSTVSIQSFDSITGMGVTAIYEGKTYLVGNESLMKEKEIKTSTDLVKAALILKSEGKTVIYIACGNNVEGIMAITDKIKSNARAAIAQIQDMGVEVFMLTGDNEQAAAQVSHQLGINNFKANTLPSEKGDFIKKLQLAKKTVIMAGDGINDSYALAQANVGIAMGSGTDVAMESAGITLIYSDLEQIVKAIALSKATMRTIRQNLFWAFIYNLVAIPVAAGVLYPTFGFLLNPMIAGAAMSMSSISVLINSLWLKKSLN